MKVKTYMIAVYAVLVKNGKREIEELPEAYIIPVAEYLATPVPELLILCRSPRR